MNEQPKTLVMAAKEFFGYRAGTGLKEFSEEWKTLSQKDKEEIKEGLIALGYKIAE